MKNTIIIGTVFFKVVRSKKYPYTHERYMRVLPQATTLEDCYARPSTAKQSIYKRWWFWSKQNSDIVKSFSIASYNCNIFTLHGCAIIDGQEYVYYISPCKNEIYPVI